MPGKRIGFIDDRLDNFHADVYLQAVRGPLAARGFAVAGATALVASPSKAWAAERGIPYFSSVDALADQVDFLMVLAPSNPDVHLELCRQALPHRKPTFVDKTFAPDEKTAREMFALADHHGVAVQSTSALRTTAIQHAVANLGDQLQSITLFAAGSSLIEYGIHPVEAAVSCLGWDAEAVMRIGSQHHPQWVVKFSGDRRAVIDFNTTADIPYSAVLTSKRGCQHVVVDGATLFIDAAAAILDFFDAGRPLIDRRETLLVRRILDLAMLDVAHEAFVSLRGCESNRRRTDGPHDAVHDFSSPRRPADSTIISRGLTAL